MLSFETYEAMREWLAELDFADIEPDELWHLNDSTIERAVEKLYDGGVAGFLDDAGDELAIA